MLLFEYSGSVTESIFVQEFLDESWDGISDIGWNMLPILLVAVVGGRGGEKYPFVRFVRIGVGIKELLKAPRTCLFSWNKDFFRDVSYIRVI